MRRRRRSNSESLLYFFTNSGNPAWKSSLEIAQFKTRGKMKHVLSAIAVSILLTTAAGAEEITTQSDKADGATEDCSKQVWPHFSPSCLHNADRAVNVRLITDEPR
jgi:hypothetical protein